MSEQNETKKEKSKISSKPLERVTIEEPQKEKLTLLTSLANESLNGMATISKSDLVNMILEQHPNELSKLEIEILRKSHLDIFKHLSWLQAQAKLAKESGNDVSLAELMKKSSDFLSCAQAVAKTKKPRKLKSKPTEGLLPDDGQDSEPEKENQNN